jgi:hypothetical protein
MAKTERLVIRLHGMTDNPQLLNRNAPTPPGTLPSPHRGYRPRRRSGHPSAPGRAIRLAGLAAAARARQSGCGEGRPMSAFLRK